MRWNLGRFLSQFWRRKQTPFLKRPARTYVRLTFEPLESRELLSGTPPTILGAVPVTGTSTGSATPVIQVDFSDTMTNAATNPSNYILLGATGTLVPINAVNFIANPLQPALPNSAVQLTYNGGSGLVVDTYTLYVRGNDLFSASSGLAMSQPGQLFAANAGKNTVSVVNVAGDGTLSTLGNYNTPASTTAQPAPNAVALADVNGDGIADLIVANSGTDELTIYAGQAASLGGGYDTNPTLTLSLPAPTPTASHAESIVVADFDGDKHPDIAVASGDSDNVTVFLNTSGAAGVTSFATGVSYAVDSDPVGITAGDFDGDGNIDLAVAINGTTSAPAGKYRIDLLPGSASGTFGTMKQVIVANVTIPTSIASGTFTSGALPQLVLGGTTGLEVLTNASAPGTFTMTEQPVLSASSVLSVATGNLQAGALASIADTTTAKTVEVFQSTGGGAFAPLYSFGTGTTTGQVAIGDVTGDGLGDIVVANGQAAGTVQVFKNTTIGGNVVTAARNAGSNIVIDSPNNGLTTGQLVTITGDTVPLANVTSTAITILGDTVATITAVAGTVSLTSATSANGLAAGDKIVVSGTGIADGTFTVTSVAGNTVTYSDGAVNGTAAAAGSWTDPDKFSLNGTAGGIANGTGGTWVLTDAITAANEVGGVQPIVITSPNNKLKSGDSVTINGFAGAFAPVLNGNTYAISILTSAITTAQVNASGVITITASSTYGLANNDTVTISGNSLALADGTYTIGNLAGNTFTIANASATTVGANGTGGSWTDTDKFELLGTTTAGTDTTGTWTSAQGFTNVSGGSYSVDTTPVAVAIGDTNQDGDANVVTANIGGNDVSLLLGNGDGTLQTPTNLSLAPTVSPASTVIVADLNDDGIPDLIVANNTNSFGNTKITIYPGLGNGQYGTAVSISPGNVQTITTLGVGAFSAAAGASALYPDIVYADSADGTIGFLQNKMTTSGQAIATTSFAASPTVSIEPSPTAIAVGDFNNDGLSDLAISYNGAGGHHHFGVNPGVDVLINTSTSSSNFNFSQTQYDNGNNTPINSLAVGDFNNDGNLDFIAAIDGAPGQIVLNTGDGLGNFSGGTYFGTTIPNPVSIAVGDFNNDGYKDVVVASSSTATTNTGIAVLMNQLGTGFGTPIQENVAPGTGLQNVVIGDINGDGVPDIVVSTATVQATNITGATNTSPITINTGFGGTNGLQDGMTVTVTGILGNTAANGIWTITNVTFNSFDLVNSTGNAAYTSGGTWAVGTADDNVYVLMGAGNGTFANPVPYLAGQTGTPFPATTYLAITPSPLLPVTTFTTGGNLIGAQLINNGDFESRDLAGETGNLLGWQTYDEPNVPGSAGQWLAQTGTTSPLSSTVVPLPSGNWQAMLDEPNLTPITTGGFGGPQNNNTPTSYSGSHALYQDVSIPANASAANFSMALYIDNTGQGVQPTATATPGTYSDPSVGAGNPSLDFNTAKANQQVRVDVMLVNLITAASNPGSGQPIVVTSANDGLINDQQVTITGVLGNTAANGMWKVKVINANQFALYSVAGPNPSTGNGIPAIGNGAYAGGGEWTNNFLSVNAPGGLDPVLANLFITDPTTATTFSTVVTADLLNLNATPISNITWAATGGGTVTVTAANSFLPGESVVISGMTPSAYNNTYTVLTANSNNFTFALASNPGAAAVLGTAALDLAGKTVRIRIASANNQGPLLVAVDNAKLNVTFNDTTAPTLRNLAIANPSFVSSGVPYTDTPTIQGTIGSTYGLGAVAYIAIDPTGGNFTSPSTVKTTQWDATGNFSYTLTNVTPGLNAVNIEVVDRAGNVTKTIFTFYMQTSSVTQWLPAGPESINVTSQGVGYTTVSGRITATVVDALDPTGNTYLVGTVNGGIWRSTDGGNDWLSLTNNLTDASGNPLTVSVGALCQAAADPNVLYAGTGVADDQLDSIPAVGVGILKSTNDGLTWTLLTTSTAAFAGARISAIGCDPNDIAGNTVYVAVASGGSDGPGVYKTTDGGKTWIDVLSSYAAASATHVADNMHTTGAATNFVPGQNGLLPGGTPLGSVTSMVVDRFNAFGEIIIGMGSMGLGVPASVAGGAWYTVNGGASWLEVVGQQNPAIPNDSLPSGLGVGRITVAMGTGNVSEERYTYFLVSSPPGNNVAPNVDWGSAFGSQTFAPYNNTGLYKSLDNMLNFTHVMLRDNNPLPLLPFHFTDIDLTGRDGTNAGALLVDPTDPNVVYVGGSSFWFQQFGFINQTDHALLYVDTGDMLDTVTPDAFGNIVNNGDDVEKWNASWDKVLLKRDYDPGKGLIPYTGEGVYAYDLIEGQSIGDPSGGPFGQPSLQLLPEEITTLSFDSLGRLLVGTSGGLWRGINEGFSYDFTSDGAGILGGGGPFGPPPFSTPGMTFTSINGNLSISDMTSVAIDPFQQGVYYTTQVDTGVASLSPTTGWVSQGLTGPTTIVNGNTVNLGIPTAVSVLTAFPSTPGDPVVLYRIWQYADPNALVPEYSTDGGTTWNSIPGIPSAGTTAGSVPGFAINPTPLTSSGISLNQLLFGAVPAYDTATSSTTWNPTGQPASVVIASVQLSATVTASTTVTVPSTAAMVAGEIVTGAGIPVGTVITAILSGTTVQLSAAATATNPAVNLTFGGQLPTAAAIAPSNDLVYYLGDDHGEVWSTQNHGGTWSIAAGPASGLPAISANNPIKGITVNPTNSNIVFAMFGGTGSAIHVYESTNGGINFTPITGGWGTAQAYSMVIDASVGLGAPNGKIYLATQVGVYASINGGTTWAVLGQGMPNVPVVSLAFNPTLQTLAAATLGRGVYTINTSAISVLANQTINEDTTSPIIPFTVNNVGGATYTITASSSNPSLIPNGNIVLGGSASNPTVKFTPALHAYSSGPGTGNYQGPNPDTITLTLTSGTFVSTQSFQVTVNFVNVAPTISTISNQTINVNTSTTLNFTVGDVETVPGQLTVTASFSSSAFTPAIPLPSLTIGGAATITAASWAGGVVTVSAFNPFKAGQTITITGMTPAGYNGNFTLAGATPNGFTFDLASNPGPVTAFGTALGTSRTLTITPATAAQLGDGVITLTVTDTNAPPLSTSTSFSLLITEPVTLPFTDSFTRPNSVFVGPGWNVSLGAASLSQNQALTSGALNIISLNQLSVADIALQGDVNMAPPITTTTSAFAIPKVGATTIVNPTSTAGLAVNQSLYLSDGTNSIIATVTAISGGNLTVKTSTILTGAAGSIINTGAQISILTGSHIGFIARYGASGDTNYYEGGIYFVNGKLYAEINRNVGGKLTLLTPNAAATQVLSPSGTLVFEVAGSTLRLFYGPTGSTDLILVAYASDTQVTGPGTAGLRSTNGGTLDNFSANSLAAPPTQTLPVADPLNNASVPAGDTQQNQLSTLWINQAGNLYQSTNGAVGASTAAAGNIATLANLTAPNVNVSVQASVTLTTVNQRAGVVARYQGPGSTNYYSAQVVLLAGNKVKVSIYKGATVIGTSLAAIANPGAITLTFEAEGSSLKAYINNNLAAYADDAAYASGSVGIFATAGAAVAGFQAGDITPSPLPSLVSPGFSGDFSTPNLGNQLSTNWVEAAGNFTVASSTATGNATTNLATLIGASGNNVSVQADVAFGAKSPSTHLYPVQAAGLVAAYTGPVNANYYEAKITQESNGTLQAAIVRNINGTPTTLFTSATFANPTPGAPVPITFEVEGPTLKLFVNNVLEAYAQDRLLTTGSVGIYGSPGAGLSNFQAVALTLPSSQPTPFTGNFSANQPGNQLDINWMEQAGDYNLSTGAAVGQAALNLAVVNGISESTSDLLATVNTATFTKTGQFVDLVARYSGPGDANMYYAQVMYQGSGKFTATIYRKAGTTAVALKSMNLSGFAGGLEFQVSGNSLTLIVDATTTLTDNDTATNAIAGPGQVGMRTSAGVAVTSFTAN